MNVYFLLLAILAGIFTTFESSINSQLGKYVSPGIATLHSLFLGTLLVLVLNIITGNILKYPKIQGVNPLWLCGGLFGASIIYLSARVIPQLGISNAVILILTGQLLSGLVIDALANDIEVSLKKMLGMILFLIGTIMFIQE